ncbi:hypothetical protein EV426DRAFT_262506 [Tirmania nivea]|nr:hypothetical protein EV426DRAFT_262506 [Tirmania nivea]
MNLTGVSRSVSTEHPNSNYLFDITWADTRSFMAHTIIHSDPSSAYLGEFRQNKLPPVCPGFFLCTVPFFFPNTITPSTFSLFVCFCLSHTICLLLSLPAISGYHCFMFFSRLLTVLRRLIRAKRTQSTDMGYIIAFLLGFTVG